MKMGEPKSMDLLTTLRSIDSGSKGQHAVPQPAPGMGALVLDEDF